LDLRIACHRDAGLSTLGWSELRELSEAVFPPEVDAAWPGRRIDWARAEWWVRIWTPTCQTLSSCARLVLRDATHDAHPVVVGGIGGLKTHPDWRRRGLAALAVRRSVEFFHAQPAVAFALLTCEPALVPYYSRLGWRKFDGTLLVTQHSVPWEFTFDRVMVRDIRFPGPTAGTIDLQGPPW